MIDLFQFKESTELSKARLRRAQMRAHIIDAVYLSETFFEKIWRTADASYKVPDVTKILTQVEN